MANTNPTLFGQLKEIHANVERARADVVRLRSAIKGKATVGGERTSAGDMRIQLREALGYFDELLFKLTPIPELHSDQPIRVVSRKKRTEVPDGN